MMYRALTMSSTGTKIRPHPHPIGPLMTQLENLPPTTFLDPAAMSIPVDPNTPYPRFELTRYTPDFSRFRFPSPAYAASSVSAPIFGIHHVFIRWEKVRPPSSSFITCN